MLKGTLERIPRIILSGPRWWQFDLSSLTLRQGARARLITEVQ